MKHNLASNPTTNTSPRSSLPIQSKTIKKRKRKSDPLPYSKIGPMDRFLKSCENNQTLTKPLEEEFQEEFAKLDMDQQNVASDLSSKYLLVQGAPGSGKTHVMILRAAHLLKSDLQRKLLIVTFSKKAEQEIHSRLFKHRNCSSHTQQIVSPRALRDEFETNGKFDDDKFDEVIDFVQRERAKGTKPSEFIGEERQWLEQYEKILSKHLTLDSLIEKALGLFKESNSEKLTKDFCCKLFTDMFIDEFQDTSIAQYNMLTSAAGHVQNLTVLGDANQAIYSFIGSTGEVFHKFTTDFPDYDIKKMNINYRSNQYLVTLANKFMNTTVKSRNECNNSGRNMQSNDFSSKDDELNFIISEIQKLKERQVDVREISVLFRRGSPIKNYALKLEEKGIAVAQEKVDHFFVILKILKFVVYGGSLRSKSEADDKLVKITEDLVYISKKLKSDFENIGGKTVKQFMENTLKPGKKKEKIEIFEQKLKYIHSEYVKEKTRSKLIQLLVSQFKPLITADDLERRMTEISDDQLNSWEALSIVESSFYSEDKKTFTEGVSLLTIHKAKGLEWKYVFLPEFQDGIMPLRKKLTSPNRIKQEKIDLEEEKRICYVALTRAKEYLYITSNSQKSEYAKSLE